MGDFSAFLSWEEHSRDTIDLKKIYIDMADDLVAGVMLSQIVYWYLPAKDKSQKIVIQKGGKEWIAKSRHEWWDEIRLTPKQVDRAIKLLVGAGLLEAKLFKFNNTPTKHVRLNKEVFLTKWQSLILTKRENPFLPKGRNPILPKVEIQDFDESVKSITKTTEITSESTNKDSLPNGKGGSEQSVKAKAKVPTQPKHSKAELDAMYEAIADAWKTDAGGWIGSMRKMFWGEATRGAWKECNFNPPATPDEITAFAEWWSYKKLSMPTEAVKIQKHFYDYRKEKAKPQHPSFRRVTQEELESGAYQDVSPEDLPEPIQAALNAWMEKMGA